MTAMKLLGNWCWVCSLEYQATVESEDAHGGSSEMYSFDKIVLRLLLNILSLLASAN